MRISATKIKLKLGIATLLLSACASGASAQSLLPDKPSPSPARHAERAPAGREFWLEAASLGAAWTLDTISTAQTYAHCPTCVEAGGLFNGERSTAKSQAAWGGIDIGAVVLAYEWKRRVHNKWLHPLWRVPMLVGAASHAQAAGGNWTH